MSNQINIKLFPSIEEVFENPSEEYQAIFFPLLTIDLASINKGTGKVHFITVYGNGNPDYSFPGDKSGFNFIRFKIIGNKYRFEGDINQIPQIDKAIKWYEEAKLIYQEHKEQYFVKTDFAKQEDEKRAKIDFDYYHYIKGVINYWLTRDKFIETGKFIQGNAYSGGYSNHEREVYENVENYDDEYDLEYFEELLESLGISQSDVQFIGTVAGYNYSELGEDEISLFICRNTNEVLQYFNWS